MKKSGPERELPIEEAMRRVGEALRAAYACLGDRSYRPGEREVRLLRQLAETLWHSHAAAEHLARAMQRRHRGEPEEEGYE